MKHDPYFSDDISVLNMSTNYKMADVIANLPSGGELLSNGRDELSKPEVEIEKSETESDSMSTSEVDSTSTAASELLTETVLEEEKKVEELDHQAEKEEEKELNKRKELWSHMDNETKEMRYQRLQCLLMKSNMYTDYVLKRMERQKEEEKKRRERILKKLAKAEKVKKEEQEEMKKQDQHAGEVTVKDAEESSCSVKHVDVQASPARTRCSLRAPIQKSKLSQPNTPVLSPLNIHSNKQNTPVVEESTGKTIKSQTEESATSNQLDAQDSPRNGNRRSSRSRSSLGQPEDSASKLGRKRKTPEQSPNSTKLLTHFQNFSNKRKKVDKESEDVVKEEADKSDKKTQSTEPETKQTKVKEPDFEGEPEINDDGTIKRPALFSGGELRKYQVEGLNWLKVLFENGVNGILADEMGLGKTIQVIALVTQIITMGATGPFIVVAPLSTIPNWKSEFKRFAPMLPVVFYHGSKDDRASVRHKISKCHRLMKDVVIQPVVITSYEMAMIDKPFLRNYEWTYMIVDEGHRIKNKNCRLVRELKQYKTSHRLLLTGTPLQNNLGELWSLLNFLLPEIFDDLGSFETWFDVEVISNEGADEAIIREEQKSNILGMLHQILTPFMLRRVKADVDLQIPPKKELLVYAPLTSVQQQFYESTVDRTILQKIENKNNPEEPAETSAAGRPKRCATKKVVDYSLMMESPDEDDTVKVKNKKKEEEKLEAWIQAIIQMNEPVQKEEKKKVAQVNVRLQNIMMQLRKVCNHPYLLEYPLDPETGDFKVDEDVVNKSGKMMVLEKMLVELKKRGHKVLIFSQMTKMLDILEDYCLLRELTYCRLDGSCGIDDRQQSMEKFNNDPDMFLFLLSTRAGGLGINLVAADTAIIYDSDWNPQNDLQAQDRCHRIGQTRPVVVYRFVTANTIDQRIVERAAAKRKLEKMIIQNGKFKSGIANFSTVMKPISPEELLQLLKSKDYSDTVNKTNDCVISEDDLNALLDRSDMLSVFDEIKKGKKIKKEENEAVLRTTVAEASKLFQVVDYDHGGTTTETNTKEEPNEVK